jgi:ceramide glucosyltransferase
MCQGLVSPLLRCLGAGASRPLLRCRSYEANRIAEQTSGGGRTRRATRPRSQAVSMIRYLVLVAAAAPLVFYLAAVVCAWFFFRRRDEPVKGFYPPVSVLKPMRGLDRETYNNLASFCQQKYPNYELLFCTDHERDPAIGVIHRLMADFPHIPIRLFIGPSTSGSNNKVTKLCRLEGEACYDLLVVSDSDIRAEPDYLRRVALPFCDQRTGAVTCLYRGSTGSNLWSELEDVALTSDFLAGVLVARKLGVKFALGATMAVRRQVLTAIGGFRAFADAAADDHELGNRVAACGYRVELAHTTVETECISRSLRDFFQHQLRWSVVTRESQPWGHLGFLFAQGLPWVIVAAAAAPSRIIAGWFVAAYLALRLSTAFTVGVWGLRDSLLKRKWWLVLLSDACGFVVWLTSLFTRRVVWQDSTYDVRRGRLIPIATNQSGLGEVGVDRGGGHF